MNGKNASSNPQDCDNTRNRQKKDRACTALIIAEMTGNNMILWSSRANAWGRRRPLCFVFCAFRSMRLIFNGMVFSGHKKEQKSKREAYDRNTFMQQCWTSPVPDFDIFSEGTVHRPTTSVEIARNIPGRCSNRTSPFSCRGCLMLVAQFDMFVSHSRSIVYPCQKQAALFVRYERSKRPY